MCMLQMAVSQLVEAVQPSAAAALASFATLLSKVIELFAMALEPLSSFLAPITELLRTLQYSDTQGALWPLYVWVSVRNDTAVGQRRQKISRHNRHKEALFDQ